MVVSIVVTNIGNESQSFFAANQKLMDSAGREYSPDSKADMWINKAILTDINPGNHIEAKVAFDVPEGTQPSAMELHDSMFSGGSKGQAVVVWRCCRPGVSVPVRRRRRF